MRGSWRWCGSALALVVFLAIADRIPAQEKPAPAKAPAAVSDAQSKAVADQVMQTLGGQAAWDKAHYVRWLFFGRRLHYWDKWTGDVRIEMGDKLVLMNIHTRKGRVWEGGVEVTQPDTLANRLEKGFAWWTNDSYWVFMPYKLQDPGVRLRYVGERAMQDGRPSDVIELTFAGVGMTPENKYDVMVDKETHLVGEWSYYNKASDAEPRFTMPWKAWRQVGPLMLAGDHGREEPDWRLAVYDELPRTVFTSPDSVHME